MVKEIVKNTSKTLLKKTSGFKNEFKHQTVTAISAAFGLVIALSWKDVITFYISKLNPSQGLLASAITLTALSVLGLLILSKWSKQPEVEKVVAVTK